MSTPGYQSDRRSPNISARTHQLQWARCIYVYDGETIHVETGNTGQKLRIANLHTPQKGEPNYEQAKQFVKNAVLGRWVGLENHRQQWDTQGVRIASVWYSEGFRLNLATSMKEQSLGVEDPQRNPTPMRSHHPRGALSLDPATDVRSESA